MRGWWGGTAVRLELARVPVRRQSLRLAVWAGKQEVCNFLCVLFTGVGGAGRSNPKNCRRGSKPGRALGVSVQPVRAGT